MKISKKLSHRWIRVKKKNEMIDNNLSIFHRFFHRSYDQSYLHFKLTVQWKKKWFVLILSRNFDDIISLWGCFFCLQNIFWRCRKYLQSNLHLLFWLSLFNALYHHIKTMGHTVWNLLEEKDSCSRYLPWNDKGKEQDRNTKMCTASCPNQYCQWREYHCK